MNNHLAPRLEAIESAAKELLEKVTAADLRADLELAIRDVAEAHIWMRPSTPANEPIATLAARAAELRIAKVEKIVEVRGYGESD